MARPIAASAAGFDVTASDYYAEALEFVTLNARANHVAEPQGLVLIPTSTVAKTRADAQSSDQ